MIKHHPVDSPCVRHEGLGVLLSRLREGARSRGRGWAGKPSSLLCAPPSPLYSIGRESFGSIQYLTTCATYKTGCALSDENPLSLTNPGDEEQNPRIFIWRFTKYVLWVRTGVTYWLLFPNFSFPFLGVEPIQNSVQNTLFVLVQNIFLFKNLEIYFFCVQICVEALESPLAESKTITPIQIAWQNTSRPWPGVDVTCSCRKTSARPRR